MNNAEMEKLCTDMVNHIGCEATGVAKSLSLWKSNLLNIGYDRALESIKVNLINGSPTGKDPGKWFAAIIRYSGVVQTAQQNQTNSNEPQGCETCRHSGTIEVPSLKDWNNAGQWKGIYTQVVACECGMGQMRACQMMPLRQYQSLRPGWMYEYPMRKYERALRELLAREEPHHREDKENHRRKIRWLQIQLGEVSEKEVEPWSGGTLKQLLNHCTKQIS